MLALMLATTLLQAEPRCYAIGAAPPASCPAWRSHYRDDQGEMSADPASLRRDGTVFVVTARVVFAQPIDTGARTLLGTYRYDCRVRTAQLLHFTAYDNDGAELADADAEGENAEPANVNAGTPNAALLDAYCPR